ncbi:MAG: hypothetical protein NTY64_04550 [Deltaproteobacteria bacterium]|nr:hypothetical protein [Deltaproteobacteria bacterium]
MDTIQLKTVDPLSQELLKFADEQGIKLNWERYERLQPQDGFLRLGLSCPYGCLQGPCRIDPFGRGPDRGLCGLDRDRMVAALLLRLMLNGALEAMNEVGTSPESTEPSLPPPLVQIFSPTVKRLGGKRRPAEEISRSAFYLHRPMESPEDLILQALRLGVLTVGLLVNRKVPENLRSRLPLKVGYGLLAAKELLAGVCGQADTKFLEEISEVFPWHLPGGGRIVSLGSWVPFKDGLLPCVCTSGEAELVVSSGRIRLLIAGPGTDPSLIELCRQLNIPFIGSENPRDVEKGILEANQRAYVRPQAPLAPDPQLVEEVEVIMTPDEFGDYLKKNVPGRLALLGGADHLLYPLGWIPVEVASSLRGENYRVAGWGDAALWMAKKGLASAKSKTPALILDNQQGPLLALKALAKAGRLRDLKGVCFAGVKSCQDLAQALGFAALGVRVCITTPLPLWGSEGVRRLLAEKITALGGSLTHFDHPAHAQEILEWFLEEGVPGAEEQKVPAKPQN